MHIFKIKKKKIEFSFYFLIRTNVKQLRPTRIRMFIEFAKSTQLPAFVEGIIVIIPSNMLSYYVIGNKY